MILQSLCRWWLSAVLLEKSEAVQPPHGSPEHLRHRPFLARPSENKEKATNKNKTDGVDDAGKWYVCVSYLKSVEEDIAQVEDGWKHSEHTALVLRAEVENIHGTL